MTDLLNKTNTAKACAIEALVIACKELSRWQDPVILLTVTAYPNGRGDDEMQWEYYPSIVTYSGDANYKLLMRRINENGRRSYINHRLWVFHDGKTMVEPKVWELRGDETG